MIDISFFIWYMLNNFIFVHKLNLMKINFYLFKLCIILICSSNLLKAQTCYNAGNGSDGAFNATTNTTIPGGEYNFTTFNISSGVLVTVTGNIPLKLNCNISAIIDGTLSVSGGNGSNGITFSAAGVGGIGVAGGANGGNGSYSSSTGPLNGTSGSGTGGASTNGSGWSGGGGAGYANTGSSSGNAAGGFGGPSYGNASITPTLAGSGGGGGSGGFSCGAGGGGAGGGIIIVNTPTLLIGASGNISSDGGNGGSDGTGNCGGGGGGSGGSILLAAPGMTINGLLSAKGGIGGASTVPGPPYYGTGANGSDGRIRLDYNGALSGTGSYTPVVGYTNTISPPILASINSNNALCFNACNGSATVSASGPSSLTYSWIPGNFTTSAVSALCVGNYTAIVYDASLCSVTLTLAINQPSLLLVNATSSSSVVCAGNQNTITANSSGGTGVVTYSWSNATTGSLTIVNPTVNSTYTVLATDANSCTATSSIQLNVNPLPSINVTASPTSICSQQSTTLSASGANTYTWNTSANGSTIAVTPSVSTSYTVEGTDGNGCIGQSVHTTSVIIPSINVVSSSSVLCVGSSANISASGAVTYTWNTSSNSSSISVSPSVTTNYTVNGTDANGCIGTSIFTQSVTVCNGVFSSNASNLNVVVLPNPSSGKVKVEVNSISSRIEISLVDQLGKLILQTESTDNSMELDLSNLINGIYYLKVFSDNSFKTIKLIKN